MTKNTPKIAFNGLYIYSCQIPGVTDEDISFLLSMFQRYNRVFAGYALFTATDPKERIELALKILETEARAGWVANFDLPLNSFRPVRPCFDKVTRDPKNPLFRTVFNKACESILEHCTEGAELFPLLYPDLVRADASFGAECFKYHDITEAIHGDFRPNTIQKAEKKRLEALSLELLCADCLNGNVYTQHIYNCVQIFEGHIPEFAPIRENMLSRIHAALKEHPISPKEKSKLKDLNRLYLEVDPELDLKKLRTRLKDVDAVQMAVRACRMRKDGLLNSDESLRKMEMFWRYIQNVPLQTPEADAFYKALRKGYNDTNQPSYPETIDFALQATMEPTTQPSQ